MLKLPVTDANVALAAAKVLIRLLFAALGRLLAMVLPSRQREGQGQP